MSTTQSPTVAAPDTGTVTAWKLDPAHTVVEFSTKHMMLTTVKGRFADVRGTITADRRDPERSSVEVEIAAASIDTRADQRDQHLRSADFLDAAHHPAITFESTRVKGAHAKAGDRFEVTGDLTIRGVTRQITLDCTFEGTNTDPWGNLKAGFTATSRIDRRDWGLTWNQALETGGILVGNDVRISVEAQAVQEGSGTRP